MLSRQCVTIECSFEFGKKKIQTNRCNSLDSVAGRIASALTYICNLFKCFEAVGWVTVRELGSSKKLCSDKCRSYFVFPYLACTKDSLSHSSSGSTKI